MDINVTPTVATCVVSRILLAVPHGGLSRYDCPNISSAFALVDAKGAGLNVTVTFRGTHSDGPYEVTAPAAPGGLRLQGDGAATIDGGLARRLLKVHGGRLHADSITFRAGYVNATFENRAKSPVFADCATSLWTRCTFTGNRGSNGGAMLVSGWGSAEIRNCTYTDNHGYGGGDGGTHDTGGGGALCVNRAHVTINNSYFADNVATDPPWAAIGSTGTHHGGAVMNIEGHVVAENSTFLNGNAYQGGALYTWMWGDIVARRCLFENNSAVGATHNTGGAIFTDRGSAIISDSSFVGNVANDSGAAIYGWSASGSCKNVTGPAGKNTTVCQNVTIERCEFRDNLARCKASADGYCGVVANQWSTFAVTNSSCRNNTPADVSPTSSSSNTTIRGGSCHFLNN